jgi:hypothetical protein
MSPISPLLASYQASGGPKTVASPTPASVTASIISCDATEVWFWNVVAAPPHPESQPEPASMSGRTP